VVTPSPNNEWHDGDRHGENHEGNAENEECHR
jgi:hypothetical protein